MIQSIMLFVLQSVFFLISLVLYVFLTACVLPCFLLKFQFSATTIRDRGIKKYLFENGRAIVYLPDPAIRSYIPQYILSDNNGERFLKCLLNPEVFSLHYYVFSFDAQDRPVQVLEVEDPIPTRGVSKAVPLPLNTSYVTISLKNVNGKTFQSNKLGYSMIKMLVYLAITVTLTILEALMIKQGMLYLADLLFAYSDMASPNYGATLFTAMAIGIVYALIVVSTRFIKGSRINK
jgi:hypothetical protein